MMMLYISTVQSFKSNQVKFSESKIVGIVIRTSRSFVWCIYYWWQNLTNEYGSKCEACLWLCTVSILHIAGLWKSFLPVNCLWNESLSRWFDRFLRSWSSDGWLRTICSSCLFSFLFFPRIGELLMMYTWP